MVQWYIFRSLVQSFVLLILVITGIAMLILFVGSLRHAEEYSLALVLSKVPYYIPSALEWSISHTLLIASLVTYGRLAADNEILAIRMGGVNPLHVVTPGIVLGLAMAILTLWLNSTVAPEARAEARRITKDDFSRFLDSMQQSQRKDFKSEDLIMEWQDVVDGAPVGVDFDIQPREGLKIQGHADRVRIAVDEDNDWIYFFIDGYEGRTADGLSKFGDKSKEVSYPISNLFVRNEAADANRGRMASADLRYRVDRDPRLGRKPDAEYLRDYRLEYYQRIGFALSCLLFVLVGAPVGMLIRRGAFLIAMLFAIGIAFGLFHGPMILMTQLSESVSAPPVLAAVVPSVLVGGLGIHLVCRVIRA